MNLMYAALNDFSFKNNKINEKVTRLKERLDSSDIKLTKEYVKDSGTFYFENSLPIIGKNRDVLKKPVTICKIYMNWKKKKYTVEEALNKIKPQYGWVTQIVDAEYKRNKFKNRNFVWVIYDTLAEAEEARRLFNSLFITALEWDTIEEYKKFKENPEKRPLTFDQQCENAYELYQQVDDGEI